MSIEQRAESKYGQINWHCCQYASYCIYGDQNRLVGAKNWLNFGSPTNNPSEAKVIVAKNGSHVGVVLYQGSKVAHSPGFNSNKPIKEYPFSNFTKYVIQDYILRK